MKHLPLLILSLSLCLLAGCKTQNLFVHAADKDEHPVAAAYSLLLYDPDYQYTIRKDDKISISVWGHDDLSVGSTYGIYNSNEVYGKWLMVDPEGAIEVPRFGNMEVENMTILELKRRIKDSVSTLLLNPIVDIKVLNREITLMGEFKAPAVVKIDKEKNYLLDLVARAGGFDAYANKSCIKIFRQRGEDTHIITVDLTAKGDYRYKNLPVYPGDIVIAPSRGYKEFDRRVSVIIPFTSAMTASAIFLGAFGG
ncbi:polysaccharide biosynthesis/export family protein [Lewinella sp. IMCC34191]|uniref:polysaccharide biosynthesis/export family protein n=1 Tax=Lewinella sp. IMCC34191 TaxID=2259172 RepID=UPI001300209F|nr:polysaccharide biosynthesis/export family protein [Lewinella sp. IMCC34191]